MATIVEIRKQIVRALQSGEDTTKLENKLRQAVWKKRSKKDGKQLD